MSNQLRLAIPMVVAFFTASLFGDVWYVDAANYGKSGDGKNAGASAFGTIQEAVDAANANDTIMVAAGVYEQGETQDDFTNPMMNRVYISKPLTLCGADRHTTIIKGSKATDDPSLKATARKLGLGSDAVRCIGINASDVVISNFTITGGATCRPDDWDDANANGGGVYAFGENVVVANCVISNNVARRGSGVCHAVRTAPSLTVVRSWIHGNFAENDEPIARGCLLAFCLVTGHPHTQEPITDGSVLVNCTFAGNRMRSLIKSASAKAYNCLFADEWYKADDPATTNSFCYANCAFPIGVEMFLTPGLTNNACIFSAGLDHFVSPIDNDYRLHQGAANAIDKGDAAFLQEIPQQYRYRDFSGAEISENAATVSLGCLQEIVSEVGGTVRFSVLSLKPVGCAAFDYNPTNDFLFGEKNVSFAISGLAYARGVSARGIVRVRCSSSDWKGLYGFKASGSDTVMRYPLMDGTYEIMIPPEGKTLELSPVEATSVLYVDKNSKETEEDGSNAFPFKKIQSAVDSVASGTYGIVYVKEGIYDEEPGKTAKDHLNRVSIAGRYVRLVSADGVGKATISGGSDPDVAKDEWPFGCGAKAMRCVYVGEYSVVQGFALTGGRCNISGTGDATHGGAAYLDIGAQLLDCRISNSMASQGAAVFGNESSSKAPASLAFRCLIAGNYGIDDNGKGKSKFEQKGSGVVRRTTLASCIVSGNYGQGFGAWESQYAYHSTLVGPALGEGLTFLPSTMISINSLSVSPKDKANAPILYGGTWLCSSDPSAQSVGVVKKDALVADPAAGDFRISALSPARDAAVADFNGGGSDVNHSQYYIFGATDFYGNRFAVNEDGLPVCGAVSLFAPTLAFDEKEVAVSAPTVSEDGKFKVTCTAVSAATRPYLGMAVNGVTQETVSANCDFTVENAGNHPVPYEVEALYDTKWFVDEKSGNDSGWGTESSPKATLKGALQYALPGDSVFVAPGVYSNGVQYAGGELATGDAKYDFDLAARAVVTNDVKLIGAGAERTFIVGESAPNAQEEDFGCGEGAVRCIVLHPGSSLSGFTLTGGRTKASNSDNKGDALCGGGILASWCKGVSPGALYSSLPRISDCVISNCVARRGGGVYNGVYNRCRLMDNKVVSGGNGSAGRGISKGYFYCFNTIIDRNAGFSTTFYATLENCTIGDGNSQDGNLDGISVVNNSPLVLNSLILGNKGSADSGGNVFSNCVFNTDTHKYLQKYTTNVIGADCIVDATDDQLQVDENYTPAIGANRAVDAANASYATEELGTVDVHGNPRKVNGARLDVGAVEADWKGEYSRVLGSRVCVTEASPEVLLDSTAPGVQIPAGAKLSLTYGRQGSTGARTEISASVGGTLTAETESWSRIFESGEGQTLSFKTDSDFTDFLFTAGDGTAVLHGISRRSPFAFVIR